MRNNAAETASGEAHPDSSPLMITNSPAHGTVLDAGMQSLRVVVSNGIAACGLKRDEFHVVRRTLLFVRQLSDEHDGLPDIDTPHCISRGNPGKWRNPKRSAASGIAPTLSSGDRRNLPLRWHHVFTRGSLRNWRGSEIRVRLCHSLLHRTKMPTIRSGPRSEKPASSIAAFCDDDRLTEGCNITPHDERCCSPLPRQRCRQ